MARLTRLRRFASVLLTALVVGASSSNLKAAEPTPYLPDGTMFVLTLNVKQLLQAPLVRADEKAFRQMADEAAKALGGFGVDPRKDVDRVVLAVGEKLKAATTLVLLEGRFDTAKVEGRLRDLARERKNDMQVIEDAGATFFQGRLPRQAVPDPKVTLPERFLVTVLDASTIAFAADRAALAEAVAKRSSARKAEIKPRVLELVGRIDPRETLSVVFVPPAELLAGGLAAGLTGVTGGVTVAEGVNTEVRLDVKDAEASKRLSNDVTEGLTRVKELLPGLAAFQPGVGRREQEAIKEMLDTFKIVAKPDAVLITSTISKELIDKNSRKDQ
jgi:hypothetical protein